VTRKVAFVFLIFLIVALVVAGCGGKKEEPTATPTTAPAAAAPADPIAQGKQLYAQSCASCHGPDGKGVPNLGKDLTTSEFAKGLSDDEMLTFLKQGRAADDPANTTKVAMPPKGGNPALTDDQLKAIIAYVRTLEK